MDDLGIDQWLLFGYGGDTPAATLNIHAIARGGVRFHNMWSMPACSNGRAALFTGRYPLRTNVFTAIGNNDLANYMVNPNETTIPMLLKKRGYESALFGKFHLGIQSNDPYGDAMVPPLGFDYYEGWLDATGDPSSIDTTAGGVAPPGTWSCGFVQDAAHGGADTGACYAGNGSCQMVTKSEAEAPGRICRDSDGIFDPNQPCTSPVPAYINFSTLLAGTTCVPARGRSGGPDPATSADNGDSCAYFSRNRTGRRGDRVGPAAAGEPTLDGDSQLREHSLAGDAPPVQILPRSEPDSSN
jgi:Sulfatase